MTHATKHDRSSPPPGWIIGEQARRMFSVSQWTWDRWLKEGKISCGKPVGPSGRFKWYPIEELRRVIDELRKPQPFPPPGMVDEDQARQMFRVSTWMWDKWRKQGKLRCGQWILIPGGGRTKLYPVAELRRVIEELRSTGPFPPPGWVGREEACRMFDVAIPTWTAWTVQGKVPAGQWFMIPGGGRCRLYRIDDLESLLAEMKGPGKAYPDPKRPGHYIVPSNLVTRRQGCRMFGVSLATWKHWQKAGLMRGSRVGCALFYDVEEIKKLLPVYGPIAPPYPDPDRPGTYRLPLTSEGVIAGRPNRREATIDAESLPLVQGRRWGWIGPTKDGGLGHVAMSHVGETTALHRFIMGVTDPDLTVMHLNDDPLDCRRANLVVRTFTERSAAARKARTYRGRPCTSRFKGVCWKEDKGKWVVQIRAEGVNRRLGYFDDELAAAQAYDEAAFKAWGEHARLNFPDGVDARLASEAAAAPAPVRAAA